IQIFPSRSAIDMMGSSVIGVEKPGILRFRPARRPSGQGACAAEFTPPPADRGRKGLKHRVTCTTLTACREVRAPGGAGGMQESTVKLGIQELCRGGLAVMLAVAPAWAAAQSFADGLRYQPQVDL